MCRSDLFIWLSETLKLAENKYKHPIQLVVVGDFYQLPPVLATPSEKEYFANGKVYAFNTADWKSWHFKPVVLHQIIRQTNDKFSKALTSIREGNTKYIHYLNSKSAKNPINKAITVVSTNKEANTINLIKVNSLQGKWKIYNSQVSGKINDQDKPTPDRIKLKVGALVVFTANASDNTYTNGALATVTQLSTDYIKVKIENSSEEITVFPFTWTIYDYRLVKEDNRRKLKKVQIGEYQQLPVKLGYAITIHKSQGQTYLAANIAPAGWLSGLLYVALSRVKDINQLHLLHKIEPNMVNADPTVIEFYKHLDYESKRYSDGTVTMKIPMILRKKVQEISQLDTIQIRKLQLFIRDLINTNYKIV